MAVDLAGNVSNQAGTAKVGLTVELWEKSAYEGSGSRTGSTTTDSQGNWAFTGQDITKLWLVVVVDGTKKVLPVHSEGSQQLTKLDLITDMNVNTINEHTAAAGVTIDSVVLKDGGVTTTGAVTVGSDGSGADVIFYSGTAGDNLTWDASEELLTITGTDGNTALNVADGNVTIADDLTVSGDLVVTGTTTTVNSAIINATTGLVFEGTTADAHETTLGVVDPGADATINLPAMSAGTYYLPVLAAASTTSVSSTPAELNLLDGSSANSVVNSKAVIYGSSGEVAASSLTVDDVAVNGKVVTMTGSTDDTAVLTVGTNGTLSLVTTDTAAAAANIQITADGTVDIDSAGVLTLDSGAAINIEPASGSAILLDGTISVDAGVVTGATSITSTAFLGTIDGVVGGNTPAAITGTTIDANTDFTIGTTVITDDVITFTPTSSDTVVLTAATNGAFSLVTTDANAAAANIQITADGTVDIDSAGVLTLDSGAAINIEPAAGSAVLIDGNVSIDGDAVTGIATLAASGVITAGGFTIGSAAILEAELEILDGASVTTAELNIIDGDTSATGTTIADADRVVLNDNGTMVQVAVTDLKTYIGGSNLVIINTAVADDDDDLTISGLTSTYNAYLLLGTDLLPTNDAVNLEMQVGPVGGIETGSTDYEFHTSALHAGAATYASSVSTGLGFMRLVTNVGNGTGEGAGCAIWLTRPGNGTTFPLFSGTSVATNSSGVVTGGAMSGRRKAVIDLTQVLIKFENGTIATGRFTVYGVAHA